MSIAWNIQDTSYSLSPSHTKLIYSAVVEGTHSLECCANYLTTLNVITNDQHILLVISIDISQVISDKRTKVKITKII